MTYTVFIVVRSLVIVQLYLVFNVTCFVNENAVRLGLFTPETNWDSSRTEQANYHRNVRKLVHLFEMIANWPLRRYITLFDNYSLVSVFYFSAVKFLRFCFVRFSHKTNPNK